MLNTLIKKQFMEIFRSYYVNRKTGKARSRGAIAGLFVLYGGIMLVVAGMFFGVAASLGGTFVPLGLGWLMFALMGILTLLFGVFGSVFSTYASLYRAKDNDLLISMPIPPRRILLARLSCVVLLSLFYCGVVWVPAVLYYAFFGAPSPLAILFGILLFPLLSLLTSVLTCFFGWITAMIAGKLKNKTAVTVILSLLFFGAYYYLTMRSESVLLLITRHSDEVASAVRTWGNLFYQIGHAATGELLPFLLIVAVTAAASALCFLILSKTFLRIATTQVTGKKAVYHAKNVQAKSVPSALLRRDTKRFFSSALYLLNCGLGIVILPAIGIVLLIKSGSIPDLGALIPELAGLLPGLIAAAGCLVLSLDVVATPSVSLEGKAFWILRSLPVRSSDILRSKRRLHFVANALSAVVAIPMFGIALRMDIWGILLSLLLALAVLHVTATTDLLIGIRHANFTWVSETTVIKQSVSILFAMMNGWLWAVAAGGVVFLLGKTGLPSDLVTGIGILLFAAAAVLFDRLLVTRGVKRFEAL